MARKSRRPERVDVWAIFKGRFGPKESTARKSRPAPKASIFFNGNLNIFEDFDKEIRSKTAFFQR